MCLNRLPSFYCHLPIVINHCYWSCSLPVTKATNLVELQMTCSRCGASLSGGSNQTWLRLFHSLLAQPLLIDIRHLPAVGTVSGHWKKNGKNSCQSHEPKMHCSLQVLGLCRNFGLERSAIFTPAFWAQLSYTLTVLSLTFGDYVTV